MTNIAKRDNYELDNSKTDTTRDNSRLSIESKRMNIIINTYTGKLLTPYICCLSRFTM